MVKEVDGESLEQEIEKQLEILEKEYTQKEFYVLFQDKHDVSNAVVSIHAGTGGTEAQDWADMLLRMMFRYCEKREWTTTILDKTIGNEAGIKSVTFSVQGRYAYGHLKAEAGVHRLVRISPFDAESMRHTSFALIEVIPEIADAEESEINPKDLRIDTFLSSGAGGQHVQKTSSAVRIVHLPTNITVSCQSERSQHQNKATAMKILQSKLYKLAIEQKAEEIKEVRGEVMQAVWGNQIKSYVLQPYKMVKDTRTKYETSDTQAVLDGDLDPFIHAFLKWNTKQKNKK